MAGARLLCAEPVFKPGSGSTENSLVATDRSIVVENNFGYKSIDDTENGHTKPKGPANTDAWYFTAIDFETGETVYKQLAGTGTFFNNHYSAIYLGPDGRTAYVGVLGGIVAMRDTY